MPGQYPLENEIPARILQSIVETAIDGIFLIDTDGKILMCNKAAHQIFGYESGELMGKDIAILMPSPYREHHSRYIKDYIQSGNNKIIGIGREIEGLRKNGSFFPARLAVSEIIIDRHHFFTGILQDLTEKKQIEEALITLNQELEQMVADRTAQLEDAVQRLLQTNQLLNLSIEKHKAGESALLSTRDELKKSLEKEKELGILKSRFISMASHEFKTPLSSILSSAALILRYDGAGQEMARKRHVDRIKASVTHLNTILTDFLSITRLEEGKFDPQISRFKLDALLDDLHSEMEVLLKTEQTLTFEYCTNQLLMHSDKNIIRNILYNLLSNAIKYSEERTSIHVRVRRAGQQFIFDIRDEGMGIPQQDQKHIGTRFFRASNVSHLQGTGLGLNIVKTYLNFLKGDLTFRSNEDKGTTFTLSIPVEHEK